jgi:hypothetical protein
MWQLASNQDKASDRIRQSGRKNGVHHTLLKSTGGMAVLLAALLAHSEAAAQDCGQANPSCHLENGKKLMGSDPKGAAAEFLTSFKLDERTDTLVLYAKALEADQQDALAAETWQRIITYRESELTAAKESRNGALQATAKKKLDEAAGALIKLNPKIARVRIKFGMGVKPVVSRDGVEVDATKEIIVKSGKDELLFTKKDGTQAKHVVSLTAGENVRIDAPDKYSAPQVAKVEPKTQPKVEPKVEPKTEPKVAVTTPSEGKEPVEIKPKDPAMQKPWANQPRDTKAGGGGKGMSRVGLIAIAGGVVLGGVATGFGIVANNDFNKAIDGGCDGDGNCPIGNQQAIDLANRSNDRARVAQITAIGAGALIATGVTLWFLGKSKEKRQSTMSLHVGSSSAALAWRF